MKDYLNNLLDTNKNHFVAPAIIFGVCFIIFGAIVSFNVRSAITSIANKDQSITVTGTTEKDVISDTAKWTVGVTERVQGEDATAQASKQAEKDVESIKAYLLKNGIDEKQITVQPASLAQICQVSSQGYENCSLGVIGESATQNILVETGDVYKIQDLTGRITNEISGVNVANNSVEYYYDALKDIRVQMLSDATANAKERAEAVAKAGGANVGNITSVSTGVFQVTQKNSVNVDDYGAYDTSTIEKKITATVKVNFSVR